ncbi:MAG: phosphotransferase [Parvularculaceae bacterium]|nr:phosphotransferase [Parvularculaceae bacterium]
MTNAAAKGSDAAARRADDRRAFLEASGWGEAIAFPMAGDASTRSYERLSLGERTAVLMNAPPAAEGAACPPDATPEERRALGYNAMARLAGPNLNAFTAIATALREAGLSAPDIYAADAAHGFAVIEDLGDDLFARAIPAGADEGELYGAAIDALLALHRAAPAAPAGDKYRMLTYDRTAMEAEVMLVPDWYWPHLKGAPASAAIKAEYAEAWSSALAALPAPSTLVLRDFHAENLLWIPARRGHARAGVIDFQDGLFGNPAYDLVSFLEDARRDVSVDLAEAMIRRYAAGARAFSDFDEDACRRDYAILGAQRNAKILGIFARLIRRDGKPRYADFFPRVEGHFRRDLQHTELRDVAAFFRRHFPERFA